jgi:hypothetical protein
LSEGLFPLTFQVPTTYAITPEDLFATMNIIKGSCLSIILSTLAFRASAGASDHVAANNSSDNGEEGIQFRHFVAYNSTQTCSSDTHALPFNNQIRGVNIGGWMVLEPWITPSLFYQFLGGDETNTAMDHYSFCQVLGAEEGNRQLRRHWESWVTQDIIKELAESGAVNSLRVPVGDFMFEPYGPYIGCTDGALDYLDTLLDWAHGYGLSVLLDVHTQKDSQNGFDNSGLTMGFQWTSRISNCKFQVCVSVFICSSLSITSSPSACTLFMCVKIIRILTILL